MNECNAIHETALGTAIELMTAIKDLAKEDKDSGGKIDVAKNYKEKINNNGGFGTAGVSLAKADSRLTMVFPILCSKGISIENASMISKAMERHFVGMLQRIFAAYQIANDNTVSSAADFVSQFHKNLDSRFTSMDDIMKITGVTESSEILTSYDESFIL